MGMHAFRTGRFFFGGIAHPGYTQEVHGYVALERVVEIDGDQCAHRHLGYVSRACLFVCPVRRAKALVGSMLLPQSSDR